VGVLRRVGLLAYVACASDFTYDATLRVDASATGVAALSVDGMPVSTAHAEIHDTFPSLDDAMAAPHRIVATTASGDVTLALAPTRCGDNCVVNFGCDSITAESEQWVIGPLLGEPIGLLVESGSCDVDGQTRSWSE